MNVELQKQREKKKGFRYENNIKMSILCKKPDK